MVSRFLAAQEYPVYEASTVEGARALIETIKPSLVLLDLSLEDGSGYPLLEDYGREMGFIVVSAKSQIEHRLTCLGMGAWDYIVKPLDLRELLLRIRTFETLARRDHLSEVESEFFTLDVLRKSVRGPGGAVALLTVAEFTLLRILMEANGDVAPRDQIAKAVSRRGGSAGSRAIDVIASKLRGKLSVFNGPNVIGVRGAGYKLASAPGPAPASSAREGVSPPACQK
jgi:DNA-binding response OmpR family regulator